MSVEPLLAVRDLAVSIGGEEILHSAALTVEAGRLVAVVGPNGAGKSTLARTAAGLQRPTAGSVSWGGSDVRSLRGRRLALMRAFVPQRAPVPDGLTVRDAVTIGRSPHIPPLRRATRSDRNAVESALARTGVSEFADRLLTTLSGGELQRVQIAVALAQEAPVLIADEPTSHLDLGATVAAARLLRGLAEEGLGVLVVVHDLALAAAIADTIVVISEGRSVAEGPPADALTRERLAQVWRVDAGLELATGGRTALRVEWLREAGLGDR